MSAYVTTRKGQTLETPSIINFLFSDKRASVIWLIARVWLGYQWISASLHKLSSPDWMVTGNALKGFWMGAVKVPTDGGKPAIAFAWYRGFLQAMLNAQAYTWFAKVVAVSEFLIGLSLILGIFIGFTAFFGGFMNVNYLLAGTVSTNPILFLIAMFLVLAWKTAGWWGVDRWVLTLLGTPWSPGRVFKKEPQEAPQGSSPSASP